MASTASSNHSTGFTSQSSEQANTAAGVSSSQILTLSKKKILWKKKILSNMKNLENLGLLPSTCQYRKPQNEEFLTDKPQQIEAPILDIEAAEDDAQTSGNPKEVSGLQESVKVFRTLEDSVKMLPATVVDGDADEDNAQSGRNPEEVSRLQETAKISQVFGDLNLDADADDAQTRGSHKKVSFKEISAMAGEKRTLAFDPDAFPQEKKLKISFHQSSEQPINVHGPGMATELAIAVHEQSEPTSLTIETMLKGPEKEWSETETRAQKSELMAKDLQERNRVPREFLEAAATAALLEEMKALVASIPDGAGAAFTTMQLQELEQQSQVYQYMAARVPVPTHLIFPVWKCVTGASFEGAQKYPTLMGLATLCLDRKDLEPEPGRCRRTDGKRWRCRRNTIPNEKYCERHMHRGCKRPIQVVVEDDKPDSASGSKSAPG